MLEERERLEGSLISFFEAAWPNFDPAPYVPGWHLEAIAEHLEAVSRGEIRKLLINVPPRHSKTLITSVAWPAWLWAQKPDPECPLMGPQVKFLCLSYGDQLAMDNATTARRLIASDWFQERWGSRVQIMTDQDAKNKFDSSAGGTRISAAIGAGILGRGGDIKILDDPHKSDEGNSEIARNKVIDRYKGTLKSRMTDPKTTAEVIIMQRLHESDLSGYVLETDPDFVHLNLPAEYDTGRHCQTSIGWEDPRTDQGELLWPARFGPAELAPFKRDPYEWAGMWQQTPSPRGGGILKREWWQLWDGEVAQRYGLDWDDNGRKEFPDFDIMIAFLDTAYTSKTENDYSALTVWGAWRDRQRNRKFMLVNAWQERLEFHDLVTKVGATSRKYRIDKLLIENKAAGISVGQEIQRLYGREEFGVELVDPKNQDKVSRAHSIVHLFSEGMVWAPETKWSDMVIDQCSSFPRGSHDDLVDTVTGALRWLRDAGIAERNEEAMGLLEDSARYRRPAEPIYDV